MASRTRSSQPIDLELGTRMLLNLPGSKENLSCELVGGQHFEYLILKTPPVPGIRSRLLNGDVVTLRFLAGGTVFGFRSEILNHVVKPGLLLFLEYPEITEQVDLRRHRRVNCLLPASLHSRHGTHKCILRDLSEGGCKVSLDVGREDPFRETTTEEMLVLQCALFGADGQTQTTLPCIAKSICADSGRMQLGLKFDNLPSETQMELAAYLESVSVLL